MADDSTIVACATGGGQSAIAMIRLSGQDAIRIADRLFVSRDLTTATSHTQYYGDIEFAGEWIDEVMLSVYRSPRSFTGEDMVEISCHGSPLIVNKIIRATIEEGARYAEAGEFSRRAFLNGKRDLVQTEAIGDLIDARTDAALEHAKRHMRGDFSTKLQMMRTELVELASLLELELDFGEEDVEFANRDELQTKVSSLQKTIVALIESFRTGQVLKEGIAVVIVGAPNVGKSTLLNALVQEERAIVTDIAGTTRDVIESTFTLGGYLFRCIDTAGIRQTTDTIEKIGIERSYHQVKKADIILTLTTGDSPPLELEYEETGRRLLLTIINKVDEIQIVPKDTEDKLHISAKQNIGIDRLQERLLEYAEKEFGQDDTIVSNIRHYQHLSEGNIYLTKFISELSKEQTPDILSHTLRYALDEIGQITGDITTDELLGNIFGKFCIGK